MAEMKLNNNAVICNAKAQMKAIQCTRHKVEWNFAEAVEKAFDDYPKRLFKSKPKLVYPMNKANWMALAMLGENSPWYVQVFLKGLNVNFVSEYAEKQYETCLKLKCMAQINEEEYMTITQEEAVALGIC
jgi:hypothetical protein